MADLRLNFNIPKRKQIEKETLVDVDINSRDAQDILQNVTHSYVDAKFVCQWPVSSVTVINNKPLDKQYRDKKQNMKYEGRSNKELNDKYMFLARRGSAGDIPHSGLCTGQDFVGWLGSCESGIYVSRHADLQIEYGVSLQQPDTFHLVVFKAMLGKCKSIKATLGQETNALEPTPNYDCHVNLNVIQPSIARYEKFIRSMVYLYEYDDDALPCHHPRHCLPVAVIAYKRPANFVIMAPTLDIYIRSNIRRPAITPATNSLPARAPGPSVHNRAPTVTLNQSNNQSAARFQNFRPLSFNRAPTPGINQSEARCQNSSNVRPRSFDARHEQASRTSYAAWKAGCYVAPPLRPVGSSIRTSRDQRHWAPHNVGTPIPPQDPRAATQTRSGNPNVADGDQKGQDSSSGQSSQYTQDSIPQYLRGMADLKGDATFSEESRRLLHMDGDSLLNIVTNYKKDSNDLLATTSISSKSSNRDLLKVNKTESKTKSDKRVTFIDSDKGDADSCGRIESDSCESKRVGEDSHLFGVSDKGVLSPASSSMNKRECQELNISVSPIAEFSPNSHEDSVSITSSSPSPSEIFGQPDILSPKTDEDQSPLDVQNQLQTLLQSLMHNLTQIQGYNNEASNTDSGADAVLSNNDDVPIAHSVKEINQPSTVQFNVDTVNDQKKVRKDKDSNLLPAGRPVIAEHNNCKMRSTKPHRPSLVKSKSTNNTNVTAVGDHDVFNESSNVIIPSTTTKKSASNKDLMTSSDVCIQRHSARDIRVNKSAGVTAPRGPTGVTAPRGPTGVTAPRDPTGVTAPRGPTGVTAPCAPTGVTAPRGPTGVTAPRCPTGVTALRGPTGVTAPRGPTDHQSPDAATSSKETMDTIDTHEGDRICDTKLRDTADLPISTGKSHNKKSGVPEDIKSDKISVSSITSTMSLPCAKNVMNSDNPEKTKNIFDAFQNKSNVKCKSKIHSDTKDTDGLDTDKEVVGNWALMRAGSPTGGMYPAVNEQKLMQVWENTNLDVDSGRSRSPFPVQSTNDERLMEIWGKTLLGDDYVVEDDLVDIMRESERLIGIDEETLRSDNTELYCNMGVKEDVLGGTLKSDQEVVTSSHENDVSNRALSVDNNADSVSDSCDVISLDDSDDSYPMADSDDTYPMADSTSQCTELDVIVISDSETDVDEAQTDENITEARIKSACLPILQRFETEINQMDCVIPVSENIDKQTCNQAIDGKVKSISSIHKWHEPFKGYQLQPTLQLQRIDECPSLKSIYLETKQFHSSKETSKNVTEDIVNGALTLEQLDSKTMLLKKSHSWIKSKTEQLPSTSRILPLEHAPSKLTATDKEKLEADSTTTVNSGIKDHNEAIGSRAHVNNNRLIDSVEHSTTSGVHSRVCSKIYNTALCSAVLKSVDGTMIHSRSKTESSFESHKLIQDVNKERAEPNVNITSEPMTTQSWFADVPSTTHSLFADIPCTTQSLFADIPCTTQSLFADNPKVQAVHAGTDASSYKDVDYRTESFQNSLQMNMADQDLRHSNKEASQLKQGENSIPTKALLNAEPGEKPVVITHKLLSRLGGCNTGNEEPTVNDRQLDCAGQNEALDANKATSNERDRDYRNEPPRYGQPMVGSGQELRENLAVSQNEIEFVDIDERGVFDYNHNAETVRDRGDGRGNSEHRYDNDRRVSDVDYRDVFYRDSRIPKDSDYRRLDQRDDLLARDRPLYNRQYDYETPWNSHSYHDDIQDRHMKEFYESDLMNVRKPDWINPDDERNAEICRSVFRVTESSTSRGNSRENLQDKDLREENIMNSRVHHESVYGEDETFTDYLAESNRGGRDVYSDGVSYPSRGLYHRDVIHFQDRGRISRPTTDVFDRAVGHGRMETLDNISSHVDLQDRDLALRDRMYLRDEALSTSVDSPAVLSLSNRVCRDLLEDTDLPNIESDQLLSRRSQLHRLASPDMPHPIDPYYATRQYSERISKHDLAKLRVQQRIKQDQDLRKRSYGRGNTSDRLNDELALKFSSRRLESENDLQNHNMLENRRALMSFCPFCRNNCTNCECHHDLYKNAKSTKQINERITQDSGTQNPPEVIDEITSSVSRNQQLNVNVSSHDKKSSIITPRIHDHRLKQYGKLPRTPQPRYNMNNKHWHRNQVTDASTNSEGKELNIPLAMENSCVNANDEPAQEKCSELSRDRDSSYSLTDLDYDRIKKALGSINVASIVSDSDTDDKTETHDALNVCQTKEQSILVEIKNGQHELAKSPNIENAFDTANNWIKSMKNISKPLKSGSTNLAHMFDNIFSNDCSSLATLKCHLKKIEAMGESHNSTYISDNESTKKEALEDANPDQLEDNDITDQHASRLSEDIHDDDSDSIKEEGVLEDTFNDIFNMDSEGKTHNIQLECDVKGQTNTTVGSSTNIENGAKIEVFCDVIRSSGSTNLHKDQQNMEEGEITDSSDGEETHTFHRVPGDAVSHDVISGKPGNHSNVKTRVSLEQSKSKENHTRANLQKIDSCFADILGRPKYKEKQKTSDVLRYFKDKLEPRSRSTSPTVGSKVLNYDQKSREGKGSEMKTVNETKTIGVLKSFKSLENSVTINPSGRNRHIRMDGSKGETNATFSSSKNERKSRHTASRSKSRDNKRRGKRRRSRSGSGSSSRVSRHSYSTSGNKMDELYDPHFPSFSISSDSSEKSSYSTHTQRKLCKQRERKRSSSIFSVSSDSSSTPMSPHSHHRKSTNRNKKTRKEPSAHVTESSNKKSINDLDEVRKKLISEICELESSDSQKHSQDGDDKKSVKKVFSAAVGPTSVRKEASRSNNTNTHQLKSPLYRCGSVKSEESTEIKQMVKASSKTMEKYKEGKSIITNYSDLYSPCAVGTVWRKVIDSMPNESIESVGGINKPIVPLNDAFSTECSNILSDIEKVKKNESNKVERELLNEPLHVWATQFCEGNRDAYIDIMKAIVSGGFDRRVTYTDISKNRRKRLRAIIMNSLSVFHRKSDIKHTSKETQMQVIKVETLGSKQDSVTTLGWSTSHSAVKEPSLCLMPISSAAKTTVERAACIENKGKRKVEISLYEVQVQLRKADEDIQELRTVLYSIQQNFNSINDKWHSTTNQLMKDIHGKFKEFIAIFQANNIETEALESCCSQMSKALEFVTDSSKPNFNHAIKNLSSTCYSIKQSLQAMAKHARSRQIIDGPKVKKNDTAELCEDRDVEKDKLIKQIRTWMTNSEQQDIHGRVHEKVPDCLLLKDELTSNKSCSGCALYLMEEIPQDMANRLATLRTSIIHLDTMIQHVKQLPPNANTQTHLHFLSGQRKTLQERREGLLTTYTNGPFNEKRVLELKNELLTLTNAADAASTMNERVRHRFREFVKMRIISLLRHIDICYAEMTNTGNDEKCLP